VADIKKILVTGGLGFIGSNFVRHVLQTKDWHILNLDLKTYSGNPENLKEFSGNPRYQWIHADITDPTAVKPLMGQVSTVIHFAAETHVDRSILDGTSFVKTNVLGTQVLLEAARENNMKLFLHVSTDEVYGSVAQGESLETDPLLPNSPYAASKASSDLMARAYHVTHGLPVVVTRCSNNFGPYQYPEKALPLLITNAMRDIPFPLYGDGSHVRDWLYVIDHVKALILLLEKGVPGEIYNIGGSFSISNRDLVNQVLGIMKKPTTLIQPVADRPGHDRRYALNCDKLKKLGWKPETSFQEALHETIRWYQAHKDWWQPLIEKKSFQTYYKKQYEDRPGEKG